MDGELYEQWGLRDSVDDEILPAASQREETVPAPTAGRTLEDLFTQPRRIVRAKRSQPGADQSKPAAAPDIEGMGLTALRAFLSHFWRDYVELKGRVQRVGVPPASPAGPGSPPQQDSQGLLQEQQRKLEEELRQLQENMKSHVAATQQALQSQDKEVYSTLRLECEADLGDMRQQVSRLDRHSRRANLVIHTSAQCSQQQLLSRCNAVLQPHGGARPLLRAALQPMRTRSTEYKLWHLRLSDGEAKHALFRQSSSLRCDRIFLDDDLTKQQLEGRRKLSARRVQLKGAGHTTWWRRDVLHWADHDGHHSQSPP